MVPINQVKALSCTIPLIEGLKQLEFINNSIQDEMLVPLIFAAFMNPDTKIININNNFIKGTAARAF